MPERPSFAGLAAAAISTAVLVGYLALLSAEGESLTQGAVVFFVGLIAMGAVAAAVGSVVPNQRARAAILGCAAVPLLATGVLGIFSIGLPLLVAGILALAGAGRASCAGARAVSRRAS